MPIGIIRMTGWLDTLLMEVVQKEMALECKDGLANEGYYFAKRASIMSGYRTKELFDCKRGLRGDFWNDDDDPEKVFTTFVEPDPRSSRV